MNILELDSYNLADAVKFHNRLNHRLWDSSEHLHPQVHAKLMEIAQDFQEFLGVPDLDVKDITISGSNAAYNYTPNSDIDLHLVVDLPEADSSEVYRELFDAKKFQYNSQHNITIGGYDVELYVQNPNQEHHSQGIYSLLRNAWVSVPKRKKADIDDISTRSKYEDLAARVDDVISSDNQERMASMMKKIKSMRQSGLEQQGEFGADNLAFKLLRNNGYIKRLVDARNAARDRELSLAELARPQQRVQYGFMSESPDGVNPTTKMFLEQPEDENEIAVRQFIDFVVDQLGINDLPEIVLHNDPAWSEQNHSFGRYTPELHTLEVNLANRHIMDILRTTAHELVHCKQNQEHALPDQAGDTGSDWENEANAMAGVIMRDYAEHNPRMFENASGYIPKNKKEARDPRYSMAVSVDIKPGQVGKEANKLALNTGRNGEPQLLMKSANLRESRMPQPSQGPGKYRDLNEPLGPESPPTMPKGTVRVDVSDVYDWYKLGQHISNMKGLGKHDFGSGPPSSIISFGDEEIEHKFIKDLEATGLDVTDIDPKDPRQPQGMRKIKTDPTYNVAESELAESLRQELSLFEEQDLFEINMGSKNLRREAARTGAIAGMEFEMIVPNPEGDGDQEQEPNYDMDESCRSIQDAYDFFYDGDFNSRRDVDRMRESMREDYIEWLDEKISNDWDRGGEEYIAEWVKNNVDESEWNPDDLVGEARNDALEEYAANVHADPVSDQYQTAYEEFREENQESYDESDWLDATDLDRMSYVENAYSMSWPHWDFASSGNEASIEDVAQDFENAIGRDVRASGNYHSGSVIRPSPTQIRYVVEPDGSLEPDNPGDQGLEFVSPPLPIDEILGDLNKVKAWAKEYGCYTNDSTGLHINISVPGYSRQNLDFVKLALLMGDKYVLSAFGRSSNTYAKSALDIVKKAVRDNPDNAAKLLDKMKGNLDQLASKAIHSGITSKYTSINTKDGHIEFRSPGGDWLDQNFDQIENTLLRFTVAMSAALNPDAYRQEYLTKLYKLLSENNRDVDTIKYFSDYVAGKIPKAALRSFIKQAQLQRNIKRGKATGEKPNDGTYELFDRRTGEAVPDTAFSARNQADVNTRLDDYINFGPHGIGTVDARLVFGVRPVADSGDADQGVLDNSLRPTGPGPWEIYNRNAGHSVLNLISNGEPVTDRGEAQRLAMTRIGPEQYDNYGVRTRGTSGMSNIGTQTDMENRLGLGSQSATANYAVVDRETLDPVFRFQADDLRAANRIYGAWLAAAGLPTTTEDYGFQEISPQIPEVPLDVAQNFSDRTDGRNIDYSFRDLFGTTGQASSAQSGGEFSGQWRIVDGDTGTELFRFRSADPSQAEANRLARLWLQQNAPDSDFREIEVVPVMTEGVVEERLDELFQPGKQNWTWKIKADNEAIAKFTVGDRDYVWQAFSHFRDDKPHKWEIQFRVVKQSTDPEKLQVYGTTGTGNSAEVMSNAVDIMREFLQYYGDGVQQIAFDAKENSRIALYRKMIQRLLPNWNADEDYSSEYGLRFTLTRPKSMPQGSDLQEIATMPADQFAGGKDMLDTYLKPAKKNLKPLPGGTDLLYAIVKEPYGNGTIVQIVDPGMPGITRPVVVAVLNLDRSSLPNTVQVGSITVDEDYRGRGLAKSLYGIVLTIMRKNLVSGDSQTPGGRRNWLSLATIPGVEVRGLVRIPNQIFDLERSATVTPQWRKYADRTMDQVMELGGQFYSKDNHSSYWLFDVVPGKTSLKPAVQNALSQLYGYESDNLLLATWTGA